MKDSRDLHAAYAYAQDTSIYDNTVAYQDYDAYTSNLPPPLPPRKYDGSQAESGSQLQSTTKGNLPKPIAIPATDGHLGSPFLRAYPPDLAQYGITRETFLDFLDHLNRVTVASPPIEAVSVAANFAGLVPEPTVQVAAMAADLTAQAATYAMSKGRTELMLRQGNRDIFGPCGLKVQVAKLEAVALLAGMPILDGEGKIIKDATVLMPLDDVHDIHTLSGQERRLRTLQPWIAPLEIEGEKAAEWDKPTNPMSKMHTAVSEWQRTRGESQLLKGRKKALDSRSASTQKITKKFEEELESISDEESKLKKKKGGIPENKAEKLVEKRAKAVEKFEKEMAKAEKKFAGSDQEEKGIKKIYFLLLSKEDEVQVNSRAETEDGPDP